MRGQAVRIPITKPYFDDDDYSMISKPLETGWVSQGTYVCDFEKAIAAFTGADHAVAMNSCTSGQFLMSEIIHLKPGDEVIVPAFTWISTPNSVEYRGARAVFCDIDIATFNIDPSHIQEKITKATRAVYPVHLFGLGADMPEIMRIARAGKLKVVEDCACGLGTFIDGRHCGLYGEGGILSFHPRKSITTGEGGMIITRKNKVAMLASALRDHGSSLAGLEKRSWEANFNLKEFGYLGYNYRMTDIQGALGVAQARKLEKILERKRTLACLYNERLESIPWLRAPMIPPYTTHSYQAYCTLFKPEETVAAIIGKNLKSIRKLHEERNAVMAKLEERGISTRQGTHAVHIQKYYRNKYRYHPMDFPSSYAADKLTIALPFFPIITDREIEYLFESLHSLNV